MSDYHDLRIPAALIIFRISSLRREGRAVRWLVILVKPISDMITEHDRRQLCLAEDGLGATLVVTQSEYTPK